MFVIGLDKSISFLFACIYQFLSSLLNCQCQFSSKINLADKQLIIIQILSIIFRNANIIFIQVLIDVLKLIWISFSSLFLYFDYL